MQPRPFPFIPSASFPFLPAAKISASAIWSRAPWSCANVKPKRRPLPRCLLRRSAIRRCDVPFKPVAFTANVNGLTESEIEVVETFLRRRWDLNDVPRQWMAWRVAMPLLYKLRPEYDLAAFTYEGFLEELLHRYREHHRFVD